MDEDFTEITTCYNNIVLIDEEKKEDLFNATSVYVEKLRAIRNGPVVIDFFRLHITRDFSNPTSAILIENQSLEFLEILLPHSHHDGAISVLQELCENISAKEMMLCVQSSLSENKNPDQISLLITMGASLIKKYTNPKTRLQNVVYFLDLFNIILDPEIDKLSAGDDCDRCQDHHHDDKMDEESEKEELILHKSMEDGSSDEEGSKNEEGIGGVQISTTNATMSKIIETERNTQKEREKLLKLFLPAIIKFISSLDGFESEDLNNRVFITLVNILPYLIPNLKLFHSVAYEIMILIRKVAKKNPQQVILYGVPEFDLQSDDNDVYDFRYDIEDESVSSISLGSYAFLLFNYHFDILHFPRIFTKTYQFALIIPHLIGLLKHPNYKVFTFAIQWIMELTSQLKDESFSGTRDAPHVDVRSFTNLLRALIDKMVRVDDKDFRTAIFQLFHKLLYLLKPIGRYKLLFALQVECPYPSFSSEIITRWRQEFMRALNLDIQDSPFLRPKILEVFELAFSQNEINFLGNIDVVISALNCLEKSSSISSSSQLSSHK